jgi:hypothetical protein
MQVASNYCSLLRDFITCVWKDFMLVYYSIPFQNHSPLHTVVQILEDFLSCRLPEHSLIVRGYLKFEARCQHEYCEGFVCDLCGSSPPVLITDVDKKCCFRLSGLSHLWLIKTFFIYQYDFMQSLTLLTLMSNIKNARAQSTMTNSGLMLRKKSFCMTS